MPKAERRGKHNAGSNGRRLSPPPPALQRPPAEPPYFCNGHFKAKCPPG
jgi:hypothetical protein